MNSSLSVEFKGNNGRFASLNADEVISALSQRFAGSWNVTSKTIDKSHTKAAARFGGGSKYWITLRGTESIALKNGDIVYPQITLRDQTYSGGALQVSFGLYRLVCTNGLMAFRSIVEPVRVPHYKNRVDILMQLVNIIESSAAKFTEVIAAANDIISQPVSPLSTISRLDLPPSLVKRLTDIIQSGLQRPEDDVNTIYGLYNLINEVDRTKARKNSTAYLQRDERMLSALLAAA